MKVTLPKTVTICGKTFKVIDNQGAIGGQFSIVPQVIYYHAIEQESAEEILLHEIAEAILCNRRYRYNKACQNEQGDLLFVLTHDDFERFICDFYAALKPHLRFQEIPKTRARTE